MSHKMILKATICLIIAGFIDTAASQSPYGSRGQPNFPQRQASLPPQQPQPTVFSAGQLVSSTVAPLAYARILRQEQNNQFDGSFSYAFETENGISQQATGHLENPGTPDEAQIVQGSYSYPGPDGRPITITYVAGPDGFHAEGDSIPTPPPVPEAIARALEYIRSLPPQPDDKKYN